MEKLNQLKDELWSYAETGFEEFQSAKAMCDFMKNEGFDVKDNICGMKTAFEAKWGSGKPVITFLAEYDALDGLNQVADLCECKKQDSEQTTGHGCGHHLLGCGAIDAAIKYRQYLIDNKKQGTVILLGCPGEEAGSGKVYLARDHYFDDCDVALTWHPGLINTVASGSSQSCIAVYFKFTGIPAHAAGSPEYGRSALDAIEITNIGINYLREHMKSTDKVHYAYIDAGGKSPNVVQSLAIEKLFVRSQNNDECKELYQRVIKCAEGAALMTETKLEVIFDEGLSNLIPNETLENVAYESLEKIYKFDYTKEELEYAQKFKDTCEYNIAVGSLTEGVIDKQKLLEDIKNNPICSYVVKTEHSDECSCGSTDVGDVSWCIPTIQINTACFSYGAHGHSWQWVAQGKSSIAEKGYKLAGDVLCDVAIKLNENPDLIKKAQDELKKRLGDSKYDCLIEKDVKPHIFKF